MDNYRKGYEQGIDNQHAAIYKREELEKMANSGMPGPITA